MADDTGTPAGTAKPDTVNHPLRMRNLLFGSEGAFFAAVRCFFEEDEAMKAKLGQVSGSPDPSEEPSSIDNVNPPVRMRNLLVGSDCAAVRRSFEGDEVAEADLGQVSCSPDPSEEPSSIGDVNHPLRMRNLLFGSGRGAVRCFFEEDEAMKAKLRQVSFSPDPSEEPSSSDSSAWCTP